MKVVKLTIDEDNEFEGIDAVALVEEPAIEIDFQAFSQAKFASFDDYPQAAKKAAEQGIKRNEALGNKCGTLVGKQRAQQLANGRNITIDTIKRMRSFLLRQKDNYDLAVKRKDYDACGYISYLLWGGPSALPWAEKKLRQAGVLEKSNEEIIRDYFNTQETISEYLEFVQSADGFSVGDFVSFGFAGKTKDKDRSRGQIKDIRVEGTVTIPGTSFEFKPTKDNPLAIIKLKSGKTVGQYTKGLRKIQKPEDFSDGKYFDALSEEQREMLLKALDNVGILGDQLIEEGWEEIEMNEFHAFLKFAMESNPDGGSLQDTSNYKVLYKYEGPKDSKNRTFCRELLNKNKLYRLEDINNMSLEGANKEFATYDIFTYKGSYNCRHAWVQKFYRKDKPVDDQKRSTTTNKGPRQVIGGPRAQEAAQRNPKSRTLQQILEGVPAAEWTFSKQQEDKMLLAGPLMVADKLIPRLDEEGNKYYVFFDAEAIQKLSYKLMKNKLIDSINIEHDANRQVDDISLVETWLVEDPEKDKSNLYGYELSKGSWFGVYKVNNKEIWDNYVKTGKVKGFSVEGLFADKTILQNAVTK